MRFGDINLNSRGLLFVVDAQSGQVNLILQNAVKTAFHIKYPKEVKMIRTEIGTNPGSSPILTFILPEPLSSRDCLDVFEHSNKVSCYIILTLKRNMKTSQNYRKHNWRSLG